MTSWHHLLGVLKTSKIRTKKKLFLRRKEEHNDWYRYTYTHIHIHPYTCTHAWIYTYTYAHILTHTCTRIHRHIYTHTYGRTHMPTWNTPHTHLQRPSLTFHSLHSNLLGVCVTLSTFITCLVFLISKARSVVILMTWDCGQDVVKECMEQA